MLERGTGYFLVKRKGQFYSQRSKHFVPPDGHWRFIALCAELAQNRLHITDIEVSREELKQALYEAHFFIAVQNLRLETYNAQDILNLKTTFSL
jgi:hypothetical protein